MKINMIAAMAENRVIGKDNGMPRPRNAAPGDLQRFKELTVGHAVVMGRKTFDSLPKGFKPLKDRRNIVLTRDESWEYPGVEVMHSRQEVLDALSVEQEIFIAGGSEIYALFLDIADKIYLTLIRGTYEGDAYMPEFEDGFVEKNKQEVYNKENKHTHTYIDYEKKYVQ